ncbi:O-antigen ligase family protein [Aestuariivirga litoralis]|uniref:O-antigen ligase family protein n=1 Tax=Aestuariivirga litoralis TaxID=2650924 RepID=UPI0018C520FA|nr:O-antigen ligase family protein [Aestuariivirga litoralis]MBG1233844.1 O-antigen ligase family protein [Aestuariivirga litoralis]
MTLATEPRFAPASPSRVTLEGVGHLLVALIFFSSFFVKIEPALCDLLFFAAIPFFLYDGLKITPAIGLLFFGLVVYNLAGFLSYMHIEDTDLPAGQWVFTSFYMSLSAVFFAAYIAYDPERRFRFIMRYWTWGAVIGSGLGLMGYFHLTGLSKYLLLYERVVSTFKDPNVFSTYLVLPSVALFLALVSGRARVTLINLFSLGIMLAALFLAFSRGAWTDFIMAAGLGIILTFLMSPSRGQRDGIVLKVVVAVVGMALMLTLLLSIEPIRNLFLDRFTLLKDYDAAEMGRFGNQRNAIPILLQLPFGFGPLQFTNFFREQPHNTYLNAFVAFGWLGGMIFPCLVVLYIGAGIKASLSKTSFQASAIASGACMTAVLVQGFQIDTEHWRHLYWLIGITWGFFAASLEPEFRHEPEQDYLDGWRGRI